MRKTVMAMLLVVVMLFSVHYAAADDDWDQLMVDYNQTMKEYKQLEAIQALIENGRKIYPDNGWEAEYGFKCDTIFPQVKDEEEAKQYAGMPYLLSGTVLDVKGYGFDFKLDDGRLAIVALDRYDFDKKDFVKFGNGPWTGEKINVYCTFKCMGYELLDPNCLHFLISVSELAKEYALK